MKLILYQATFAITEIDFVQGPFRCQIEQQHLDFAVGLPHLEVQVLSIPLGLSLGKTFGETTFSVLGTNRK